MPLSDELFVSIEDAAGAELVCHGTLAGTRLDEGAIHEKLASHRLRGEWFKRDAALALLQQRTAEAAS